jgi:hypothetical protein
MFLYEMCHKVSLYFPMDYNNRLLAVSEWQLMDFVVLPKPDLIVNFVESQLIDWVNKIALKMFPIQDQMDLTKEFHHSKDLHQRRLLAYII